MKYYSLLLLVISVSAFGAGFVSGPQASWYRTKELCESKQRVPCYPDIPDRDVAEIKDVEVDDTEKPIYEFADSTEECSKEEPIECRRVCPQRGTTPEGEPTFMELMPDNRCRNLTGYEKKLVKQLVVDEKKKKDRDDAKAAKEAAGAQRDSACQGFRAAVENMVLTPQANQAALEVATRNMFGFLKNCL
jgi:hypothetical protein